MAEEENDALLKISQANNAFTFDMYKLLAAEPGNLLFSPISMHTIFALTLQGANGNTAMQIASGLHLPSDKSLVQKGFGAIMDRLQGSKDWLLNISNGIFLKDGGVIKEEFSESAARFKAAVQEVDFVQEAQAMKIINDWVEKKTNNKIKNMIAPGVLDERTWMVLVNAIYFKGNWLNKFPKRNTSPQPFHSASGAVTNVDMMFINERFKYTVSEELNSKVLLLPYKGDRLNMMIFLPIEVDDLTSLEEKLAYVNLQDTVNSMYERSIDVYFPKFKLEYSTQLNEALKRLGITDMFDFNSSDFTGITDVRLKVDKVLHKAFINVDEEGTEAAACSFAGKRLLCAKPRFIADHPFVFLILDQQTRSVLFAGRFSEAPPYVEDAHHKWYNPLKKISFWSTSSQN